MEKKTPLYNCHVELGGKIVPFAGHLMPVQYKNGVIAEHMAVRTKAGLFDVSHMGEIILSGKDALANVQMLVTNDCSKMKIGQLKYSPMCNENGGIVDDLLVYKMDEQRYMLVVNASNHNKDANWIKAHIFGEVEMKDISNDIGQIALQGPLSYEILSKLTDDNYIPKKYYTFIEKGVVGGIGCIVSNNGYTGEKGYELYCNKDDAAKLWNLIYEAGKEFGLIACGLGARDTLRLEAAMPLYGHEMNDEITPFETGLAFTVKMDKQDFIGKAALASKTENGEPKVKRVGLKITDKGIARENSKVYLNGAEIGFTTSGTHCPYLGYPVAMAIVNINEANIGDTVEVLVRGRMLKAQVVELPFYKKQ